MNQERFRFRSDMALGDLRPDFLCIGQPYAGAAWLRGLLSGHPQIHLPPGGKELGYFSFNFHRGEHWYLEQFGRRPGRGSVRRTGEVGSMYIYSDLAPSRIAAFGSVRRFIVLLRDPTSWLVARYQAVRKFSRFASDRALFLEHHGSEFDRLCLHSFLALYLALFDREDFLFITTDERVADEAAAKERVADFLEIDWDGFGEAGPHEAGARRPFLTRLLSRAPAPPPDWLFEELWVRRRIVNEQTEHLGDAIERDLSGWLIA
jgi:hypothetical protein